MKNSVKSRTRSAEFHSAVSQICNLRSVAQFDASQHFRRPADCKSAIRQSETLRYDQVI